MRRYQALLVLVLLCLCSFALGATSESQFARLQTKTNGAAQINQGPNGAVFLTFAQNDALPVERLVSQIGTIDQSNSLQQLSLAFVQEYHALWGFASSDQARQQVQVKGVRADEQIQDQSHVLLEQRFKGIRVFGGDVRAHFTGNNKLSAINGLIIDNINDRTVPSTVPAISFEDASQIAIEAVLRRLKWSNKHISQDLVSRKASGENLLIFRKDVLSFRTEDATPHLVWEVEVVSESFAIRDLVMVDARTGETVNQVSLIKNAMHRRMFDREYNISALVWEEGDAVPTDDNDMIEILKGSQSFYNLFSLGFNYLSFDGNDSTIDSVYGIVNPMRCPNAWWDGEKCSYCVNVTALDVAVHELGHGVTTYTDSLYYQYQSGALNEAYSDIFGETADILNGDPLKQVLRTTGSCSSYGEGFPANDASKRWILGDALSFETFGMHGIRDMWKPECYTDPGSVSENIYWCHETDNGGVHINSGVINHAYALAVDGGEFGGRNITGIGFNKALAVWWRAKTVYQSETSNFVDHGNALRKACSDLTNQAVHNLTTGETAETIAEEDCAQISKAIEAVNMTADIVPICHFVRFEKVNTDPSICLDGQSGTVVLHERFFTDPTDRNWTIYTKDPNDNDYNIHWTHERLSNDGFMMAPSLTYGICGNESLNVLQSPTITAPVNGTLLLAFSFLIETALYQNGGSVVAIVNGIERQINTTNFLHNGYNGVINNTFNQMDGRAAWTGSTGSSLLELELGFRTLLAEARILIDDIYEGDTVAVEFHSSQSLCRGPYGFFITNVTLTLCDSANEETSDMSVASISSVLSMIALALAVLVSAVLFSQ